MPIVNLTPALAEAIGVIGFCIYVMTYGMLTLRFLCGHSRAYMCMNLTAASCVLFSLTVNFNLASALIQIFWITMSVLGLVLHARRRDPAL